VVELIRCRHKRGYDMQVCCTGTASSLASTRRLKGAVDLATLVEDDPPTL